MKNASRTMQLLADPILERGAMVCRTVNFDEDTRNQPYTSYTHHIRLSDSPYLISWHRWLQPYRLGCQCDWGGGQEARMRAAIEYATAVSRYVHFSRMYLRAHREGTLLLHPILFDYHAYGWTIFDIISDTNIKMHHGYVLAAMINGEAFAPYSDGVTC